MLDVLYLPLHRFLPLKENLASEYYWAYKLALNASKCFSIKSIVGGVEKADDYYEINVESLGLDYRRTLWNELRFYNGLLMKGLSNRAQIVHHVMPFGFGAGQNPYFLYKNNHQPLVLGPLLSLPTSEILKEGAELRAYKSTPRHQLFSPAAEMVAKILGPLSERVLRSADFLIFVSNLTRDGWLRRYPWLSNKPYKVILNGGISESEFPSRVRNFEHELKFGVASALVRRKRIDRLLLALSKIDKKYKLLITGEGPEKEKLVGLARKNGLEEKVAFLGNLKRDALAKFYYNIDVYIALDPNAPTIEKASLQEAAMSGAPFISGQRIKPGEVRRVEGGFEVNPDDEESLVNAISTFFEAPSLLREMSEEARALALRDFSDRAVLTKLLEIYGNFGVKPRAPACP